MYCMYAACRTTWSSMSHRKRLGEPPRPHLPLHMSRVQQFASFLDSAVPFLSLLASQISTSSSRTNTNSAQKPASRIGRTRSRGWIFLRSSSACTFAPTRDITCPSPFSLQSPIRLLASSAPSLRADHDRYRDLPSRRFLMLPGPAASSKPTLRHRHACALAILGYSLCLAVRHGSQKSRNARALYLATPQHWLLDICRGTCGTSCRWWMALAAFRRRGRRRRALDR
ncbi:hypothetical protein K491DRAFT_71589 [Lophiostoma macrostomum CBS 122681]|uniref:Uncharacterized protein n=1 Tax=Lophiostoma macrostomum CBS 122681 TaxID=1314788 RepID=A0A6A6SZE6_9PLEO|nr:hypothetical protein K491DRAFT_71589 [Lophiostoma macrostomum CBS 122681]